MRHDDLFLSLYGELRQIASRLRWGHRDLPQQTTDVLHATYLRMATRSPMTVRDRAHYLALASRAMRFYLVDEARRLRADKRGGHIPHESLTAATQVSMPDPEGLLALVDAIDRLKASASELGRVMELHTFGLRHDEIAEVIGKTSRTVGKRLQAGRQELARLLELDFPEIAAEIMAGSRASSDPADDRGSGSPPGRDVDVSTPRP